MKNILIAVLMGLACTARAQYVGYSTPTANGMTMGLTGSIQVSASTSTRQNPTIILNGPNKRVTVRDGALVSTMAASGFYGTHYGNGAGLTGIPGSAVNTSTITAYVDGRLAPVTAALSTAVYTAGDQTIGGVKTFSSSISGSVTGNAGTVTNGVYTTGAYANPAWLTSVATAKVDLSTVTAALAGKQDAGGYITSLTGNVTANGPGAAVATITAVPPAAVNLSTVAAALYGKVMKSGDTMTGPLTLAGSSLTVTGKGTFGPLSASADTFAALNVQAANISTYTAEGIHIGPAGAAGRGLNLQYSDGGATIGVISMPFDSANSALQFRSRGMGTDQINMTILGGGNIGLGTPNPSAKLQITNTTQQMFDVSSSNNYLAFYKDLAPSYVSAIGNNVPAGALQEALVFSRYDGGWAEQMRISKDGKLGLHSAAPGGDLNIGDTIRALPTYTNGQGEGLIVNASRVDSDHYNTTIDFVSGRSSAYPNGGGGFRFFTQPVATTAPVETLSMTHDGNVGISSTTPVAALGVNGGIIASSSITAQGGLFTTAATITGKTALTTYTETKSSAAATTSYDVSWSSGSVYWLTLTGATTLTFSAAQDGQSLTLFLKQDATGGRLVTWPTIAWPSGSSPTLTATANKTDVISLLYIGGVYYGFTGGKNY